MPFKFMLYLYVTSVLPESSFHRPSIHRNLLFSFFKKPNFKMKVTRLCKFCVMGKFENSPPEDSKVIFMGTLES